ncbi:MAG: hypothetical protein KZQ60_08265 [Candidatus Thiodiazotropha sp. (ex Lucinoma aequizonata)]|nr:hypothetical protein [Candidatus Thiodiazotropha sp. (ex Lucinoma aequizonata)]MCU7896432.1 hypothetical protein [Candidatus Thiodiazotropha sp. (ex Lucinoma aequizonata)]MCU7899741.1 hypothetical protein [Candidatus Thiodiazotropha sp. (ex Lucinoma aequizonata)]MCU7911619.1 hypothetical protein [Candidatus Thiodiazotropha sp. (ex Lucinoma aequizonata)]
MFKDKQQYHPEAHLKNGTNADSLPPLISGIVIDSKHYIDNLFADTWKKLKINSLIKRAGFTKRSGVEVTEAVFILLLWKWLKYVINSHVFQKRFGDIFNGQKRYHVRLLKTGRDQLARA